MTSLLKPKTALPPTVSAPAVMPEADSTSVNQAKKRATELAMQRAGRASTILTGSNSGTAGDTFASSTLG